MAFRLLSPRSSTKIGLGLGLSAMALSQQVFPLRSHWVTHCDNGPTGSLSSRDWSYSKKEGRKLNPSLVRQMSSGSIIGLVAGLAVSTFSKTLAILFGMFIVGAQWAASKGFNIIPYKKIQGYVKSIDLRSVVEDNVAFKISLGTTFALAAFAPMYS